MSKYLHWLAKSIFILMLGLFSCSEEGVKVEPGVSLELALHRKLSISNINYQLTFSIPRDKVDAIKGKNTISFDYLKTEEDLQIDFNVDEPEIMALKVNGSEAEVSWEAEKIIIASDLLKNGPNEIAIEFIAGESSLNRNADYLYTLLVPDRAATAFPCFDQPDLKATYELTLTIPAGWKALANGAQVSTELLNEQEHIIFTKTKPISTYLFAFAAGEFLEETTTFKGQKITMLHRETDSLKVSRNVPEIFALHIKSLTWLEDYTSIDYPFQKFAFVLIPSFQYGGMEHPGAITYKASSLFLD